MEDFSRREFLQKTAVGAAAVSIAANQSGARQAQPAVQPPPTKQLGYAIVGIGRLSIDSILPALTTTKSSRLTALVSGHPDKAQHFAQLYGVPEKNIYNYQNFDRIASNPDVDVVYVVLPNSMHPEYTIRAAQAGKHVLCEKPMCTSVADAQFMIEACRKAGKQLMVAYRLHYEKYTIEAIERARTKIGKIGMFDAEMTFVIGDPTQWRLDRTLAGGGCMMDIGIYCLNGARYIIGEEPVSVFAQSWSYDPAKFKEGVEQNISFVLKFPSGAVANCFASYGAAGMNRYRAAGPGGWVEMDPSFTAKANLILRYTEDGRVVTAPASTVDQFETEIDAFSDAILQGIPNPSPGEEGLRDTRIQMACYESAFTGKVVSLITN